MATDGFVSPPLDSDLPGDDVAMELEEFDSIMQEPPDRNLIIKDQGLTDGFSFMPMPHSINELKPSTFQYPHQQTSSMIPYPEEQASSSFRRCSEELDEDCKPQADLNYSLHEDDIDCLASPSPGSSQSGNESDYLVLLEAGKLWMAETVQQDMGFLFDYSRLQEPFTNDCGGAGNMLDDSKSNGSTTTTDSKPHEVSRSNVVDLTNDTESDCEEDIIQSHNIKASGKRSLPQCLRPAQNSPKAICIRSPQRDGFNLSRNLSSVHEKFQSCSNLPIISRLPKSLDQTPFGIHPVQTMNLDPRVANAISNSALQENGFQRLPAFTKEDNLEEGIMTVPLLKHQRIALAWMQLRESGAECAGGILADDQGLGKTVSTIALILKSKPSASSRTIQSTQTNLTGASTVDLDDDDPPMKPLQWISASTSEPIVNSKGRPAAGTLIVCPTSVLRQWAQELKDKITEAEALTVHVYHGSNRTRDPLELAKHDIVLTTYQIVTMEVPKQPLPEEKDSDDRNPGYYGLSGQVNNKKKGGKGKKGDSDHVDNAKAGPLAKVAWFRVILDEAQSIKNRRTQAARACWGLRAKRRWCLSGTPIQNTIDDLYSYFRFLKYDPFCVYKEFRSQIKEPISRNPSQGYLKLQVILNKILLRRTKSTLIDGEPIISLPKKNVKLERVEFSAEERTFYSNLEVESRAQFQMYAAQGTVQNNYVNILWMLLRLRQACDHPRLVKGGGSDVGKSIMEHKTKLSEERRANLLAVLERSCQTCSICSDAPEDPVVSSCLHVFCKQCIYDKVAYDETSTSTCPNNKCQATLSLSTMYSWSDLNDPGSNVASEPLLHLDLQRCSPDIPESSSKIRAVINTLRALPAYETPESLSENVDGSSSHMVRTEKAIVFSQWTSMLDLLEVSLKKEGFCYRRLDGTMSIQARDRALYDFKHLPDVNVIIMSLKAASLGLNMITASHVLLIDVWWNPTTEDQAIDRAHRIGQTREVHVSRFTVKNTIEDRILQLQDRKRQIVASAFGEDAGSDQKTRLTVEEMSFLFSG